MVNVSSPIATRHAVLASSLSSQFMSASLQLPEPAKSIFECLFVFGRSEDQTCAELQLSRAQLDKEKTQALRALTGLTAARCV